MCKSLTEKEAPAEPAREKLQISINTIKKQIRVPNRHTYFVPVPKAKKRYFGEINTYLSKE